MEIEDVNGYSPFESRWHLEVGSHEFRFDEVAPICKQRHKLKVNSRAPRSSSFPHQTQSLLIFLNI